MKKTAISLIVVLILILSLPGLVSAAGTAAFTLKTSASQVRINDTVTVTGSLNASDAVATYDLSVTYPAANLQYVKAEGLSVQDGELDIIPSNGSFQFLYLDADGGLSGLGSGNIFRITFKVIGGNVGDSLSVGLNVKTVGDKDAQAMSTSGSGTSMTIAAPLSTNNNLAALNVANGSLSPAFSAATTSYSMSVPYDVSKLSLTASAADPDARVSINNPTLTPGGTTKVTIQVTAANGSQKTYTISVQRAQDPNYKASSNNDLKSLRVDGFLLSPGFDPGKTEYVVYLPFEVDHLTLVAEAADGKATVTISGHESLKPGEINLIKVDCQAEDKTVRTYTVAAIRAVEFTGLAGLGAQPTPVAEPTLTVTPMPTITETTIEEATTETTEADSEIDDRVNSKDDGNIYKSMWLCR